MKCEKYIKKGVQCGHCHRWFHFKCEGTTKERVMQEYSEEMQYICKQDKINQAKKISESKYITTTTELEELKNIHKQVDKEKKNVERKYSSITEVY